MTLQLRRGAWFGDEPYHLEFPQRWQVQVAGRGTIPCLEESGIQRAFTDPVGCKSIAELARGKRKAAIIIDDITRPTPTADLLPWIVGEVVRGGISPSSIVIVVAGGTHPVPTEGEIALKVGDLNHPGLRVVPHDCRGTLVYLGRSRAGIPIHVNPDVVECDLKVGVGCVYPHPAAGFSGGSKILLPAACGMETIRYMHDYIPGARERGDDAPTPLRSAMEEVADLLGLDCVVNAVLNQERRIAALYVGEKELAYRQGVGFVKKAYGVPRIPGANVVIADMYPFDTTLQFAHDRGLWPVLETDRNATGVVLADCPMGVGSHDLYPVETPLRTRLLRRLRNLHARDFSQPLEKVKTVLGLMRERRLEALVLSRGLSQSDIESVFPHAKVYADWAQLMKELQKRHGGSSTVVAVYPCAPFLLPQND